MYIKFRVIKRGIEVDGGMNRVGKWCSCRHISLQGLPSHLTPHPNPSTPRLPSQLRLQHGSCGAVKDLAVETRESENVLSVIQPSLLCAPLNPSLNFHFLSATTTFHLRRLHLLLMHVFIQCVHPGPPHARLYSCCDGTSRCCTSREEREERTCTEKAGKEN